MRQGFDEAYDCCGGGGVGGGGGDDDDDDGCGGGGGDDGGDGGDDGGGGSGDVFFHILKVGVDVGVGLLEIVRSTSLTLNVSISNVYLYPHVIVIS